jgi:hypothetical protein
MIVLAALAKTEQYTPPNSTYWLLFIQWVVPLIALFAFFIPLAICIWRAAKYFGSATKEQKLLRIEMGKLAEEVRLLGQEMKGDRKQVPSAESA